ncbi:MAG: beta strand repeat-containing protein, partial [Verrucomicrobiales bacterium]
MKTKSGLRRPLVLCASAILAGSSAYAGNTWDGGGSDGNWSTNANWDSDTAPGYGTLTFAGSTRTTNIVDANYNMNMLLWTGSSAWTLNNSGGSVVSLYDNSGAAAKLENQSTGLATINAPITFAATGGAAWGEINAVGGDMTFGSGTLTVNGSAVNGIKMFSSGRTITYNNTVSATGKYFATTGASGMTMNVGGAFTSGDIYLMNGSTLKLNSGGSISTSGLRLGGDFGTTLTQNLALGATFQLTNLSGGQSFSSIINTVTSNTSGALLIDSQNTSGTNTLSSNVFLDSLLNVSQAAGGTLSMTGVVQNSAGLTKTGLGTLSLTNTNTFSGQLTVANGTLSIASINNVSANGVLGNSANAVILGSSGNTGTLLYTDTTATPSSTKPFSIASGGTGVINVNNSATALTISGAFSGTGSFTKSGAGSLYLTTTNTGFNPGQISITGGILRIGNNTATQLNAGSYAGNISIASGSTLQIWSTS